MLRLPIAITSNVKTTKTKLNRLHILYLINPKFDGDVVCVCVCMQFGIHNQAKSCLQLSNWYVNETLNGTPISILSVNECVNWIKSPMLSKLKLSFLCDHKNEVASHWTTHWNLLSSIKLPTNIEIIIIQTLTFQRAIKFNLNVKNWHVRNAESTIFFFFSFCHCLACVRCVNIVFGFVILNEFHTSRQWIHTQKNYTKINLFIWFLIRKLNVPIRKVFIAINCDWFLKLHSILNFFFLYFVWIYYLFLFCLCFSSSSFQI